MQSAVGCDGGIFRQILRILQKIHRGEPLQSRMPHVSTVDNGIIRQFRKQSIGIAAASEISDTVKAGDIQQQVSGILWVFGSGDTLCLQILPGIFGCRGCSCAENSCIFQKNHSFKPDYDRPGRLVLDFSAVFCIITGKR